VTFPGQQGAVGAFGETGLPGGGMIEFDEDTDEEWGWYDGQCYACDLPGRVDDLGLCEQCRTKLEPGTP